MTALSDLRVIDLSTGVAGPFAAKLFAGFGADVTKIEPPEGDPARRDAGMFAYLNAGKRIIALNLEDADNRAQAAELCAGADVVLDSFPPGVAAKLGLGYSEIARANPAAVVASATPFGQTGPWRDWQATDLMLAAASGLAYVNGDPDREPLKEPGDVSAFQAGACAFLGAMTALAHRDLAGEGQFVDVSALEAAASAFSPQILGAMHSGQPVARGTTPLLPCKDGYVSLNVRHDATWEYMWLFFDAPEIAADTRFSTPAARRERAAEIERMLRPHLARHTMAELFHGLAPLRLLIGMTLGVDHLLTDPAPSRARLLRPMPRAWRKRRHARRALQAKRHAIHPRTRRGVPRGRPFPVFNTPHASDTNTNSNAPASPVIPYPRNRTHAGVGGRIRHAAARRHGRGGHSDRGAG